jgi:predicted PurR-regulated permease PerM
MERLAMSSWNKSFFVIFILIVMGLLYLLAPILTPFLIGTFLAYLVNPLINYLMRLGLNRLSSVIIVFIALYSFLIISLVLIIPLIQLQIDALILLIPAVISWFHVILIPKLATLLHSQELVDPNTLKSLLSQQWGKAGFMAGAFVITVLKSGALLLHWIMNLIIIPLVTFYLLEDWKQFLASILNLVPKRLQAKTIILAKESDEVLSAFFRGQLLVMLAIGIYYSIGLSLIGLKIGIILGLILGIISIVPYLGFIIGIVTASIAAYLQMGEMHDVYLVWVVFLAGQLLDALFITPNLVGDRIGLHPVAVILAVLAGGSLFGFFGVLLALPTTAVIMVWLRHLGRSYHESPLYR